MLVAPILALIFAAAPPPLPQLDSSLHHISTLRLLSSQETLDTLSGAYIEAMADVIAGLVLGGIPIALWALEKYHDPVKSYWKYDMTLSTLRDNIFVQQQQLHITLRLIGLNQPSINELRECLEEKYPNNYEEYLSIIKHMDEITKGLLDKLEIDMDGKV